MSDPRLVADLAAQKAAQADALLNSETLKDAIARLSAAYVQQWRSTSAHDVAGREDCHFMLRALDALVADLTAVIQGGSVTRYNLRRHFPDRD